MKRTSGVTIAATLALIVGVVQVLASLAYLGIFGTLSSSSSLMPMGLAIGSGVVGGLMLAFGLAMIVVGLGAIGLRGWAWTSGVTIAVLDLLFGAYLVVAGGMTIVPVVAILLSAAVIGSLYTRSVREAFGHEHTFSTTSTHHPTTA